MPEIVYSVSESLESNDPTSTVPLHIVQTCSSMAVRRSMPRSRRKFSITGLLTVGLKIFFTPVV